MSDIETGYNLTTIDSIQDHSRGPDLQVHPLEVTRAAVLAKVQGACNNLVSLKYANCPQIPTHYCT
ncbi:hypothetical protein MTR_1g083395 [Medicago truncatula]|uniref:Uncharacterized protein n=1 Tax=Medicago truncatula TaxID=3880 RepID=A0A072VYE0_MEDTR|nr:hypothetical protein MTR_1g083395 [Medicago truncatula]